MKKIYTSFLTIAVSCLINICNAQTITLNGGTITIQPNGNIAASGNLVIDGTGTLTNNGLITVKGNLTNNLPMPVANTGTLLFDGTAVQTIDGTSPIFVKNVNFNNAAGFILNNQLKADGIVDFNAGILNAPSATNPLIFTTNASIGVAPTAAKHVNGYVVREGNNSFTFPVGNGVVYQPVGATTTVNSNGLMAKYTVGNPGAGSTSSELDSYNTGEFWDVGPFSGGTATGNVTIYWDGTNDVSAISVIDRKVAHKVGLIMKNEGGTTSGNTTTGNVVSGTVSTWSPFALGFKTATALPLNLISFAGKKNGLVNDLKWETSSEINVSHFEVERSTNVSNFEKVGTVISNNNSKEKGSYYFTDYTPNAGLNYYRLKIVDLDGSKKYSKSIVLESDATDSFVNNVFPNPSDKQITVDFNSSKAIDTDLLIYDFSGKIIHQNKINAKEGLNSTTIDVKNFPSGAYMLKIVNGENQSVKKIVRQ